MNERPPHGLLIMSVRFGIHAVNEEKVLSDPNLLVIIMGRQFRELDFTAG